MERVPRRHLVSRVSRNSSKRLKGGGRGHRIRAAWVVLAVMGVVVGTVPAAAYPRPGRTQLLSVAPDGEGSNRAAIYPAISPDGRYVTWMSRAGGGGTCPDFAACRDDIVLLDRKTDAREIVSVPNGGGEANGHARFHSVSADGRYIAFESNARNLVSEFTDYGQVYVRDRVAGTTELVSRASDGSPANQDSGVPKITPDGRYVLFRSLAANLVPGDTNNAYDEFVRDRETGVTERVSLTSDGAQMLLSGSSSISADGRYVVFVGVPVAEVDSALGQAYVRDRETQTTTMVSVASDGTPSNTGAGTLSITADGRTVVFVSQATNLVPGEANGWAGLFTHDRETGVTERVPLASDGSHDSDAVFGASTWPAISADGRYIAYTRSALDAENNIEQAFVYDREIGVVEPVSVTESGGQPNNVSNLTVISADGRYVAFHSAASDLVSGSPAHVRNQIFLRDRGPALGVGMVAAAHRNDGISVSGWATFSGQVVTSATDYPNDGTSVWIPWVEVAKARDVGAEITGASVTYRPEEEDLLVRLHLAALPNAPTGGAPGITYGLGFHLAEIAYEVRARPVGATVSVFGAAESATMPNIGLYRCEGICLLETPLTGGIGTTGNEVRVSVPLAVIDAGEGMVLHDLRAYAGVHKLYGEPQPFWVLDSVRLPDGTIPVSRVELGVAPLHRPDGTTTNESHVTFDTEAALTDGHFSGTVAVSSLPGGDYALWARACLGEVCEARSTPVTRQ